MSAGGRRRHQMCIRDRISTYVDSYIFPPVVRGIERVLSKRGYTTQIAFTGNRVSREQDILNNLIDKDIIDGLIVEPAKSALPNPNLHYYQELKERGIPIPVSYTHLDVYKRQGLPHIRELPAAFSCWRRR